jgi:hypothetical protein
MDYNIFLKYFLISVNGNFVLEICRFERIMYNILLHTGLYKYTAGQIPAMKINEKNLAAFAASATPVDREGWLVKRGEVNRGYQKRWFVLKGNLLFYFEKRGDKEPVGVIVLEGCTIGKYAGCTGINFVSFQSIIWLPDGLLLAVLTKYRQSSIK